MLRRITRLMLLAICVSYIIAGARSVRAEPTRSQIASWIKQLNDDSFSQREAAEGELKSLYPPNDELLRMLITALQGSEPEARLRTWHILRAFTRQANAATLRKWKQLSDEKLWTSLIRQRAQQLSAAQRPFEKQMLNKLFFDAKHTRPRSYVQMLNLSFRDRDFGFLADYGPRVDGHLVLGGCEMSPDDLAMLQHFPSLKILSLNGSEITALPPEIAELKALTGFGIRGTKLTKLPPEIGHLDCLVTLDFYENQLQSLPSEIGNLPRLRELDIKESELTSLPPEIGNLPKLKRLEIYKTPLAALPGEIGRLPNLEELEIHYGELTTLPPGLFTSVKLRHLELRGNQLRRIPGQIAGVQTLKHLDLDKNQLESLPPEIGKLSNLETLSVSDNQLSQLPPEIVELKTLQELSLEDNQFEGFPPEVGQMPQLRCLRFQGNRLTEFPQDIEKLVNLKTLHLEVARLKDADVAILVGLKALRELHFVNTPVTMAQRATLEAHLSHCNMSFKSK